MEVRDADGMITVLLADREVDDGDNIQTIRNHLYQLVDAGHHYMVVDFSKVQYLLASAAIALLINLQKKLRSAGGALVLRNLNPQVYDLFQATRLVTIFDIRQEKPGSPRETKP